MVGDTGQKTEPLASNRPSIRLVHPDPEWATVALTRPDLHCLGCIYWTLVQSAWSPIISSPIPEHAGATISLHELSWAGETLSLCNIVCTVSAMYMMDSVTAERDRLLAENVRLLQSLSQPLPVRAADLNGALCNPLLATLKTPDIPLAVNNDLPLPDKVRLFRSLFRGR